MPTVAGNFTNYKYEAELGQPIKITLIIDSFQKPDISWTVPAGGKLGYWTVSAKTDHLYSVSTTILPEEESHLGEYEMRIRNDVGSIDVIIELVSGVVTVVPHEAVCNTSESVKLTCVKKDKHLQTEWTAKWIHQLNRIFIRSPSSEVNGNISTMTIKFCDYKDTGTYVCEWTSGEKVYKSSAKVTVYGLPVFSFTDIVVLNKTSVNLDVYFYSKPKPIQIKWLFNSKTIQHPSTLPLTKQYVNLTIYNKLVSVEGFKASMLLRTASNSSDFVYTCSIRNHFGIIEANFQEREVSDAILIWENKTKAGNNNEVKSRLDYAYGTVGVFLGLTIIVVFIVVVYRAQLMKRVSQDVRYVPPQALASVDTTGQSQEIVTDEVLQQEPDDENSLQHISIYEDIQSIQSQVYRDDTENENERVDTSRSGSDTSSERPYLELEPPNTYEDLEKSDRVEMQTYSQ
ncbi:neural cell adhesion molecule 1-like isoform X1 [Mytilus galloprovincialis]|uniref:neural cell adhesion molecule 1-like isoform X1 n=1 Tax=Mytilus galloprovincialis TaxID=29158 RepID=UPI003F7BE7CF